MSFQLQHISLRVYDCSLSGVILSWGEPLLITNECVYNAYCLSSVSDCSLSGVILSSRERWMITNECVYNAYCLSSVFDCFFFCDMIIVGNGCHG